MLLEGKVPDRVGKADAPWPETRARWYGEGVPAGVHVNDFLRMDMRVNIKMPPTFQLEEKVVDQTGDFQVISDADGNVSKYWKNKSGVPMHLKYAIQTRADWERLKDRLVADDRRFAVGYYGNYFFEYTAGPLEKVKAAYDALKVKDDTFVSVEIPDPYEYAMAKMGDENILMAMAMEPDLLKDMFEALVRYSIDQGEILFSRGFRPDGVFVGGDIAYKNGLLMSPKMYRELIFPYLKRMIDYFKASAACASSTTATATPPRPCPCSTRPASIVSSPSRSTPAWTSANSPESGAADSVSWATSPPRSWPAPRINCATRSCPASTSARKTASATSSTATTASPTLCPSKTCASWSNSWTSTGNTERVARGARLSCGSRGPTLSPVGAKR